MNPSNILTDTAPKAAFPQIEIKEIDQIAEIAQIALLNGSTVAFVDLDETLLGQLPRTAFTDVGENIFVKYASRFFSDESETRSYHSGLSPLNSTATEPIESDTQATFQFLQERVAHTFIITSRYFDAVEITKKQLSQYNLLPSSPPVLRGPYFMHAPKNITYHYEGNIIHTAGKDKGIVARDIIKKCSIDFTNLIFIDNDLDNIKQMKHAFKTTHFSDKSFHFLHYTRMNPCRMSRSNFERMWSIQSKLLIYNSSTVDDVTARIFLKRIVDSQREDELDGALCPLQDSSEVIQLLHECGLAKDIFDVYLIPKQPEESVVPAGI